MGSDELPASGARATGETVPSGTETSSGAATSSACDKGASWGARRDFAFERGSEASDFVDAVSALIRQSNVSPIAVSSHMDPGCVWMVAFSAPDALSATALSHATTFTPMLRHPGGLWTAAPQSSGWLHIVDAASRDVWIPLVDATGSATYGETSCASLSQVRVSATIPASAGATALETFAGVRRTVRDLMGTDPSERGWGVRFVFSADVAR